MLGNQAVVLGENLGFYLGGVAFYEIMFYLCGANQMIEAMKSIASISPKALAAYTATKCQRGTVEMYGAADSGNTFAVGAIAAPWVGPLAVIVADVLEDMGWSVENRPSLDASKTVYIYASKGSASREIFRVGDHLQGRGCHVYASFTSLEQLLSWAVCKVGEYTELVEFRGNAKTLQAAYGQSIVELVPDGVSKKGEAMFKPLVRRIKTAPLYYFAK